MKVAIIGDSHFDESKRFDECIRLHAWIAADAKARGVDLVLHGGDVFERKSTPREREAAFAWFQEMAEIAPVVVTRGNHDTLGDLPLLHRIDSFHPIMVVETAGVIEVAGALVACVAWPRKASLLAATGAESHEDGEALATDALRNVLRGLGDELAAHDGPTMLLMHAMVRDSMTSTGQPMVGADMEVTLADLGLARAGAYFLAHIHMFQEWRIAGAWCGFPGSPRRTNFGETEPKGYLVATYEGDVCTSVEFVEVPATPMIALEDEWSADPDMGGEPGWCKTHELAQFMNTPAVNGDGTARVLKGRNPQPANGSEIRFRYKVSHDQRVAARAAAEELRADWLRLGAISVQVEEVVHIEQRTRADAIAADATLEDKVLAFWAAKGFDPGDRRDILLSKLGQLKEAVHGA